MEGSVKIQRLKKEKRFSPQIVGKVFIALMAHYVRWLSLPLWSCIAEVSVECKNTPYGCMKNDIFKNLLSAFQLW